MGVRGLEATLAWWCLKNTCPECGACNFFIIITIQYITSLRWTIAQLNGRTDMVDGRTMEEKLYVCIVALFQVLLMSIVVGSLTTQFVDLQKVHERASKNAQVLSRYMEHYNLDASFAFTAKQYMKNQIALQNAMEDETAALELLPRQLQHELLYTVRSRSVLLHPFFPKKRKWTLKTQCALSASMHSRCTPLGPRRCSLRRVLLSTDCVCHGRGTRLLNFGM